VTPSDDFRKKRLLFRSWHRGTREGDLLLGRFAEAHLDRFEPAQLDRYEMLLACGDAEILAWVAGRTPPPEHDHDVTRLLRAFHHAPRPAVAGPSEPLRPAASGSTLPEKGAEGSGAGEESMAGARSA
jgi:antitoxin CptB